MENGPKKNAQNKKKMCFFKRKLNRNYPSLLSLTRVNSVKLIKHFDYNKNRVYLRVNTFLATKNVN